MKSPIVLLRSLMIDFMRLEPGVKGLERDLLTLELRAEHEGFSFFAITLPRLNEAILDGLSSTQFTCPMGFKKDPKGALPRLFSGLLCKVFDSKTGCLIESPSESIILCLREVLMLYKKTLVTGDRDTFLDLQAHQEFIETDINASSLFMEDRHSHHLDRACSLILSDLFSIDPRGLDYRHGPGGVYEGAKGNQKWSFLSRYISDGVLDTESYGYDDFENSLFNSGKLPDWKSSESKPHTSVPRVPASSRIARLVTVPKNASSKRTITVEPLLNQFIQQGLGRALRDSINKCPILSHCLALTDQSLNQKLALEGSRSGEWATLDLKAASDSLSVMLVEKVFARHKLFLELMIKCRSRSVEIPNKGVFMVRKFAGMGNALTFPVQSIVFATLAICAILDAEGKYPSIGSMKRAARMIRVYGDDIIVRTSHVHQVVAWLQMVGLKINHKKSFSTGNFRESCGVDAFRGVNVTPLYIKYRPDVTEVTPSMLANWVSLSNQAWLRGLYTFSATLVELAESGLKRPLPLVRSDSGVLGLHTRGEWSTSSRWNRLLHRPEYRAPVLLPRKNSNKINGYPALLKFFHRKVEDVDVLRSTIVDPKHLDQSPLRHQVKLAYRWVPT